VTDAPSEARGRPGRPVGRDRTLPGGIAAVVAAGGLVALGGPTGGLLGLAVLACWYGLGPAYAFATGQVALVAVAGDARLAVVAAAQVALFGVLVGPDLATRRGRRLAVGTVAVTLLLGGIGYAALVTWDSVAAAAVVLLGSAGLLSYGLYRYELVATGQVADEGD
jgi:hypothetical protein